MNTASPKPKSVVVGVLSFLALTSCAQPEPPASQDLRLSVISSVLEHQPDSAAELQDYLKDHPEERSILTAFLDYRLCVNRQTTGNTDLRPIRADNSAINAAPEFGPSADTWKGKAPRYSLSGIALPQHLRWDTPFSLCPSGTLFLGNPSIDGDTARVPYEVECGGLCGGGGQFILRRVQLGWRVVEDEQWWVS